MKFPKLKFIHVFIFFLIFLFFIVSVGCTQPDRLSLSQNRNSGHSLIPVPVSAPVIINKPGLYQLTTDVKPSNISAATQDDCIGINIRSSDVVFDGMGHVLDGEKIKSGCERKLSQYTSQLAYGIYSSTSKKQPYRFSNITIRNVTVSNWSYAIFITNGKNVRVENATVYGNDGGLTFLSSSNISIIQNVIIKNTVNAAITGLDVEKIIITNNTISQSTREGISLYGSIPMPFQFNLFGNWIILPQFATIDKTTSGEEYVITYNEIIRSHDGISVHNSSNNLIAYNTIQNSTVDGIRLENVGNTRVTDNSFMNSNVVDLYGAFPNVTATNNTLNGENRDAVKHPSPYIVPSSVVLGGILICLLKILTGTENIAEKAGFPKLITWFSSKIKPIEDKRSSPVISRVSSPFKNTIIISIIGGVVLGGAFTLISSLDKTIEIFLILSLIGGIVGVVPRAVQSYTAGKYRMITEYRIWWGGILVIFITTLMGNAFGLATVFGQPVKTKIAREASYGKREIALVMLSGPLASMVLSGGFLVLYLMKGTYATLAMQGLAMSLLAAVVSFLPICPMEGKRVFNWKIIVWVMVFVPIVLGYYYFVIYH